MEVEKNGKYGYINKKGKVIIKYQYDEDGTNHTFSDGLAWVSLNKKYVFIDKKGNVVLETGIPTVMH